MPIQRRPKSRANTGPKKSVVLSEPVACQVSHNSIYPKHLPYADLSLKNWLLLIGLLIASLSVLYYAKQIQHTDVQTEGIPMDDKDRAMFFVADLPGKGKGAIAARDIQVIGLSFESLLSLNVIARRTCHSRTSSFRGSSPK